MENKIVNLQINDNIDETTKAVGSLKSQLREAQAEVASLSNKFGATSREAVEAAKRAAELKDRIGDAKSLTEAFNPDAKFKSLSGSLTGVAGGFSVVTGAMGAFGANTKAVEEELLKVQSAMALASGLQAVGESIDSFKQLGAVVKSYTIVQKAITAGQWLWNAAQAANPIGAIVLAISALIAGGVALVNYFKSSAAETAANTKAVNDNKKALEDQTKTLERNSSEFNKKQSQELAMAKASGMSASAIRALELKLIDEKVAYEKSARAIAFNTYEKNKNKLASLQAAGADEDVIKSQQETTNKSILEYNKQNQNVQKAFDERKAIQNRHQVEVKQSQTDHQKEVQTKSNEAATKAKEELAAQKKKDAEDLKNALDAQKTAELAQRDEITKAIGDAQDKQAEANLSASEIEQRVVKDKYFNLIETAKQQNRSKEEIDALEVQRLNELNDIKDKFRLQDDEKKATELEKTINDNTLSFENRLAAVDAEQALFQKQLDDKVISEEEYNRKVKGLSKSREDIDKAEKNAKLAQAGAVANALDGLAKIAGEKTAAGKALAIASATINTYKGISEVWGAASMGNPVVDMAVKIASTAIVATQGIANVQKIMSVQVPEGGGGGGGSAPSAPTAAAPSFNVVGQGGANQLAQSIAGQEQQPLKAYVVSNDVTTSQSLDRNIVNNASIG